jgi:hypothetical protein
MPTASRPVVGLGGGATAGAAARFGGARLTVVELSPAVVEASRWFRQATGDVLRRPNVTLSVNDGRNHLLLTKPIYDVITADIMAYRKRFADPAVSNALRSVGLNGVEGLLDHYSSGPKALRSLIGEGPLLTDDRPLVEYFLSLPRNEPDIDLSSLRGDVREITR